MKRLESDLAVVRAELEYLNSGITLALVYHVKLRNPDFTIHELVAAARQMREMEIL